MNIIEKLNTLAEELENKREYTLADECVRIANTIDRVDSNIQKLYSIAWDLQLIDRPTAMGLYHVVNEIASDIQ